MILYGKVTRYFQNRGYGFIYKEKKIWQKE